MRKIAILVCITLFCVGTAGNAFANPARVQDTLRLTIPAGDIDGTCLRLVFDLFDNPKDPGNVYWKLNIGESGLSLDCGPQSSEISSADLSITIPFLEFSGFFASMELEYNPATQDASGLLWKLASVALVGIPFNISTSAFDYGAFIPAKFTADGPNVSPALTWAQIPAGTKSLVLIMDDPDAPGGTWTHWIVYDIPPGISQLVEDAGGGAGLPAGAKHGVNTNGNSFYNGPGPPPGPAHRYFFKLYALSVSSLSPAGTSIAAIRAAMAGKIIAVTEFMGIYARD